ITGDDVVLHPEIATAMGDQLVDLLERAGIEQELDPLARGQLAGRVLLRQATRAAAKLGAALERFENVRVIHAWRALDFRAVGLFPVLQEFLETNIGQWMV